jgi:hypothetical protein
MKRTLFLTVSLLSLLSLAACGPNRADADKKLARACEAGLKAMYGPDDTIEIKDTTFTSEKSPEDTNLRTVKFHAYYTQNHGAIEEKDYSCSFEEISGMFGYHPKFYRMDRSDMKYGSFDGTVGGDLSDMMKINQAMEAILG